MYSIVFGISVVICYIHGLICFELFAYRLIQILKIHASLVSDLSLLHKPDVLFDESAGKSESVIFIVIPVIPSGLYKDLFKLNV